MSRLTIAAATLVILGFVAIIAIAFHHVETPLIAIAAVALLVATGNLIYGKDSHYAKVVERNRAAQEAHNRAADEAHAARREAQAPGHHQPPTAEVQPDHEPPAGTPDPR